MLYLSRDKYNFIQVDIIPYVIGYTIYFAKHMLKFMFRLILEWSRDNHFAKITSVNIVYSCYICQHEEIFILIEIV